LKVAIIGTRGIPNNYGGFEKLAEHLALGLTEAGLQVYVYNPHYHSLKSSMWNGVNIIHKYDPERMMGTFGQFVYDLNCMLHARRMKFDVVLNLGYTSSSVWLGLIRPVSLIITNMDGLEWKRTKYNPMVRKFLRYAEKMAIRKSHRLIADSPAIQDYLSGTHQAESTFIAYGAELFDNPDEKELQAFGVSPFGYDLLIARPEPENNLDMIMEGRCLSGSKKPFLIVGNNTNKYARFLRDKYGSNPHIRFTGPIYDVEKINNLRYFANLYFHGHSVGGTNPSLLEAMGCRCLIAAHSNEFNRIILGAEAFYFSNADEVSRILNEAGRSHPSAESFISLNYEKIRDNYSWERITQQYKELILRK
jgi:glycosyltransferase involved in cell wall biosynthesis